MSRDDFACAELRARVEAYVREYGLVALRRARPSALHEAAHAGSRYYCNLLLGPNAYKDATSILLSFEEIERLAALEREHAAFDIDNYCAEAPTFAVSCATTPLALAVRALDKITEEANGASTDRTGAGTFDPQKELRRYNDCIAFLLERGANCMLGGAGSREDKSALGRALRGGHVEAAVRMLATDYADVDALEEQQALATLLLVEPLSAFSSAHADLVDELLRCGVSADAVYHSAESPYDGATAQQIAARRGLSAHVRDLLASDAD